MKRIKYLFVCYISLLILPTGCVQFLYPITDIEAEKMVDPNLFGTWADKENTEKYLIGQGSSSNTMRITSISMREKETKNEPGTKGDSSFFSAFLFKHDNQIWLDLQNEALNKEKKDLMNGLIPTHFYFLVVEITEKKLVLAAPDFKKMEDLLNGDPEFLKHEMVEKDHLLITERGVGIQQKLLKTGKWKEIYYENETFYKK